MTYADGRGMTPERSVMMLPVRLLRSDWPPNEGLMPGNPRFDAMLASVRDEGVHEPLTINLNWLVIDGQHRLAAARLLGLDSVPVQVWTGTEFVR
jgi:ParB-like chromosome segregation protein Spo0J